MGHFWTANYCGKLSVCLDSIRCSPGRNESRLLVSARWHACPHGKNNSFLTPLPWSHCQAQTLATVIPWLLSVGLSKQRVYSNNPRILEDHKHNSELAAASIAQKTLKKLQKALCKEQMFVFKKNRDIFSICCCYTLFVTFLGHLKKLKLKQYKLFTVFNCFFYKIHPVSALSKWCQEWSQCFTLLPHL